MNKTNEVSNEILVKGLIKTFYYIYKKDDKFMDLIDEISDGNAPSMLSDELELIVETIEKGLGLERGVLAIELEDGEETEVISDGLWVSLVDFMMDEVNSDESNLDEIIDKYYQEFISIQSDKEEN